MQLHHRILPSVAEQPSFCETKQQWLPDVVEVVFVNTLLVVAAREERLGIDRPFRHWREIHRLPVASIRGVAIESLVQNSLNLVDWDHSHSAFA